jgi:hypothetical protein
MCVFITTTVPAFPVTSASPGNHARRAVLHGEVVQHPDRVADPVAGLIGDGARVDMQGLTFRIVRIG